MEKWREENRPNMIDFMRNFGPYYNVEIFHDFSKIVIFTSPKMEAERHIWSDQEF